MVHLQMVKMVKFMLCAFYTIYKNKIMQRISIDERIKGESSRLLRNKGQGL